MSDHYKTCPVCGNKFKICWTCEKSAATSWKKVTDTYEHYAIYATIVLYTRASITKEEARHRLDGRSLSDLVPHLRKYIDEIYE